MNMTHYWALESTGEPWCKYYRENMWTGWGILKGISIMLYILNHFVRHIFILSQLLLHLCTFTLLFLKDCVSGKTTCLHHSNFFCFVCFILVFQLCIWLDNFWVPCKWHQGSFEIITFNFQHCSCQNSINNTLRKIIYVKILGKYWSEPGV